MKKNLFKGIAVASALLATVFFAACSDEPDDGRNSYIDTYKLDAVDITVKAYPGFNYIAWGQPTVPNSNDNEARATVTSVKYKIIAANDNTKYTATNLLLDSELSTAATPASDDYSQYEVQVKDVAIGSKVVFLYTVSKTGYADAVKVATTTNASSVGTLINYGEFSNTVDATDTTKVKFTVTSSAQDVANYTYAIYYTRIPADAASDPAKLSDWTAVTIAQPTWNTTETAWLATAEKAFDVDTVGTTTTDATTGADKVTSYTATYAIKYVKTNKNAATADGATAVSYTTLNLTKAVTE